MNANNSRLSRPSIENSLVNEKNLLEQKTKSGNLDVSKDRGVQNLNPMTSKNGSLLYDTIPDLRNYSLEAYEAIKKDYLVGKQEMAVVAEAYKVQIKKIDLDAVASNRWVTPNVLSVYVRYLQNWQDSLNNRTIYFQVFQTKSYDRTLDDLVVEYVLPFKNKFALDSTGLTESYQRILTCFFIDSRWMVLLYDITADTATVIDFRSPQMSRMNEEAIEVFAKKYLSQELRLYPSKYAYLNKDMVTNDNDCGLFVCELCLKLVLTHEAPENINVTEEERDGMQTKIPWVILSLQAPDAGRLKVMEGEPAQPKRKKPNLRLNVGERGAISKALASEYATVEDQPLSPGPKTEHPRASIMKSPAKQDKDRIRLKRSDLLQMMNNLKKEILKNERIVDDDEGDISQFLENEGMFGGGKQKEAFQKEEVEGLLHKFRMMEEAKRGEKVKKTKEQEDQLTFEQWAKRYQEYMNEANEFYNMLNYFYMFNPHLYEKVTEELTNQIEDQLLEKYQLKHVKYPQFRKDVKFSPSQSMEHKFPQSKGLSDTRKSLSGKISLDPIGFNRFDGEVPNSRNKSGSARGSQILQSKPSGGSKIDPPSNHVQSSQTVLAQRDSMMGAPGSKHSKDNSMRASNNNASNPLLMISDQGSSLKHGEDNKADAEHEMQGRLSDTFQEELKKGRRKGHILAGMKPNESIEKNSGNITNEGNNSKQHHKSLLSPQAIDNTKNEVITKRYGVNVRRSEIRALKKENSVSVNIIDMLGCFLQEKLEIRAQNPKLKATTVDFHYLDTGFYEKLTKGNPESKEIDYNEVRSYSSELKGTNMAIFEKYGIVVISIVLKLHHYALVCVEGAQKKVTLFDTGPKLERSPMNNQILINISKYIDKEYEKNARKRVNLLKWQFVYGNVMHHRDYKESGIIIAKLMHTISKGGFSGIYDSEKLEAFKIQLLTVLLKIGITKNEQAELGNLDEYPL